MTLRVKLTKAVVLDLHSRSILDEGLRVWVGGESGSGKSSAGMLIVSQVVEQGGQVIVLDAHGEYGPLWDVRPRDIVRYGYGDEPVHDSSVELCIHHVREGKSLLLDLSHWTDLYPQKLDAFVLEFLRQLYDLRRKQPQQTLLLIEEAQAFAPQLQMSGQAENIRVFLSIVTGGRKFGLNFVLMSQRQSLVDSNAIGGCNVRIFLRVSEAKDFKRAVKPNLPPRYNLSFADSTRSGIRYFENGEAIITTRWLQPVRAKLLQPVVKPTKPNLLQGAE